VRVQALAAEASVERLYEGVVGRLPWPREVERDALGIGPQVEIAADELGALVDPDRLRIAQFRADPFQRGDDVLGPIAEARIDCWREAREGVDHRQNPDLAARGELVVDEVHRPDIVRLRRRRPILAKLRLDPALGRLVPELQV